ncbi:MAG: SDR family oxidoreductase, partial [Mariprofundaceae bacterium]|nr:SDR family oxidoreductase [Mariprofundaceae bacterium]
KSAGCLMSDTLLIFGCGYVGEKLAAACMADGMRVIGTTRSPEHAEALESHGIEAVLAESPSDLPDTLLASADAVLDSIPLTREASMMHTSQPQWLPEIAGKFCRLKRDGLKWAGYLSATSVYGDADGAWVDETWPCKPSSERGIERLKAEQAWLQSGLPVEIFRLAGIYGPERNMIARLKAGGYKTVQWNPPHYSSRIHVDDIVAAVMAAIKIPKPGRIVNLADDEPLPHASYVTELARMIDAPEPMMLTPEEGKRQLSLARIDFFRDNKRVSNRLLHQKLLTELKYPNFREGLASLL